MKEKEIKKIIIDAKNLRKNFREKYSEIAEEFNQLSQKMDLFLLDIVGDKE